MISYMMFQNYIWYHKNNDIIHDIIYNIWYHIWYLICETLTYLTQTHTNSQASLTVTVSAKAESWYYIWYHSLYLWYLMMGVPTHGFILGHSMPPILPKIQKMNIYTNLSEKIYILKFYRKKYIFWNFRKKLQKLSIIYIL